MAKPAQGTGSAASAPLPPGAALAQRRPADGAAEARAVATSVSSGGAALRWAPVAALISTTLWFAGNVTLVVMVGLLFAQAPPKGGEFVSHEAAGSVFGLVLARWYLLSGVGLLVPLLLSAVVSGARRRSTLGERVVLLAVLGAGACHLYGAQLLAVLNPLLSDLRIHGAGGSGPGWDEFNRLHAVSRGVMETETTLLLVVMVVLAVRLARARAPSGASV